MIFTKKLFYGDYLFVYTSDDNNVVVLIQLTPYVADTPEDEMTDEEVVDTMVYDMMDSME